jgi:hypothetical protein
MLSFKNVQFTKLLKAEGALKEFNFRRAQNDQSIIFNVDVTDTRSNRILFTMQKQNDVWKIQKQGLPEWITKNESSLHALIEQELQS